MNYKPIIVVGGEPYSVFFEIFFKSIKNKRYKNPIILIASKKLFLKQMIELGYHFSINEINKNQVIFKNLSKIKINLINVNLIFKKTFDKITNNSNKYISRSFKIALELLKKNNYAGLINGPISKKNFLNKSFLGITEYLAKNTNKKNVAMLIYNKKLSVSPLTTHLALKNVHKNISEKKIIDHVELINMFYKKKFKTNPKIAITGLNPHCESNYSSSEEKKFIEPAIKYLIKKKIKISGPFPADTIFLKDISIKYDVIIGMYHDQVLTPAKTLFGFKSINITLGLPFIRISPDHGPNTKMLGKNLSDPSSLVEALKFLDK
ncbi:4-hydroxythreonine-4-phosphate dehydrogenase PdxA [Candidatus Pelagibacter sp.]|jgi:4-hydroxythreonine-4-phosphate dehydrogenase|nr:4-hydroxythreonine-4-phosphate dehydrogenase PdxA [Candidatus Pelagibacter sp.]